MNISQYDCELCGGYDITAEALKMLGNDGWLVASAVKEQALRGIRPMVCALQRAVPASAPPGSFGLDTAVERFPRQLSERLDTALLRLARVTKCLGQDIRIGSGTQPLLLARNTAEVFFVLRQFEEAGFIRGGVKSLPATVSLTATGLNRVADVQRGLLGSQSKQAFVAMSFDKSLGAAWSEGLKVGIEACGLSAMRVDAKEHNGKICDVIVAEIRKSKFLVADFTLHRAGVYFEAGLMMGLGRPVIFTCRKDELEKAHFDTRQYNHIAWETPAELAQRLKRRIEATIL